MVHIAHREGEKPQRSRQRVDAGKCEGKASLPASGQVPLRWTVAESVPLHTILAFLRNLSIQASREHQRRDPAPRLGLPPQTDSVRKNHARRLSDEDTKAALLGVSGERR